MAKNTLQSFVSATRQMLTAQLFITVAAIGLAGWTAAVTNNIIRERNALAQQVMDLKAVLRAHDITEEVPSAGPPIAPPPVVATTEPVTTTAPTETATTQTTATTSAGGVLQGWLPPPRLQNVVLHVHSDAERVAAERLVRALGSKDLHVTIDVLPRDDQHPPGYSYFDPRQQQPATGIAQDIMLAARRAEIMPWVTALPGAAVTASAEYTADRVDFVMPPLTQTPATPGHHINPAILHGAAQHPIATTSPVN